MILHQILKRKALEWCAKGGVKITTLSLMAGFAGNVLALYIDGKQGMRTSTWEEFYRFLEENDPHDAVEKFRRERAGQRQRKREELLKHLPRSIPTP